MKGAGWREQGAVIPCGDNRLTGILALPDDPAGVGVVLLVGGPQYRVGSHRQFTLLGRDLAAAKIPSLRFDYSGMGDSEGDHREFYDVQEDLSAAIDALKAASGVTRVVLWGLCDAASTAMLYAHQHTDVSGIVLLNPWVHGDEYSAKVKFSHYYRPLLRGRENWSRLISGEIDLLPAMKEFLGSSARTLAGLVGMTSAAASRHSFVQQMLKGFGQFDKDSLIILSEDDLTAREFSSLVEGDKAWQALVGRDGVQTVTIAGADHTFSSGTWMREVAKLTIEWVKQR
ncbi:MAG: hydrolase 1, exosortase A system-associated [Halioglobus sp.]